MCADNSYTTTAVIIFTLHKEVRIDGEHIAMAGGASTAAAAAAAAAICGARRASGECQPISLFSAQTRRRRKQPGGADNAIRYTTANSAFPTSPFSSIRPNSSNDSATDRHNSSWFGLAQSLYATPVQCSAVCSVDDCWRLRDAKAQ